MSDLTVQIISQYTLKMHWTLISQSYVFSEKLLKIIKHKNFFMNANFQKSFLSKNVMKNSLKRSLCMHTQSLQEQKCTLTFAI